MMKSYIFSLIHRHRYFLAVLFISAIIRFIIGFSFEASGDMGGWVQGGRLATEGVSYEECGDNCYNWPPLTFHYFKLASTLDIQYNIFNLPKWGFYKLLSLISSVIIIVLIYAHLTSHKVKNALLYTALFAFNPISLYVSAYHGQRDSVWILGVLASMLALVNKRVVLAGIFFAIGASIKVPAFFLIPLFFFYIQGLDRYKFVISFICMFVLLNIPEIIIYPMAVYERVFMYPGWTGWWGISGIGVRIFQHFYLDQQITDQFIRLNKYILYGAILVGSYILAKRRVELLKSIFGVIMIVFVFSHAFASQYTLWPLPFLTLLCAIYRERFITYLVVYTFFALGVVLHFYGVIGIPLFDYFLVEIPRDLMHLTEVVQYPMDVAYPLWVYSIVVLIIETRQLLLRHLRALSQK